MVKYINILARIPFRRGVLRSANTPAIRIHHRHLARSVLPNTIGVHHTVGAYQM
jgi:hypothetical protein